MWPFKQKAKHPPMPELDATPDRPMGFGRKTAWFAIWTDDPQRVCGALALQDVMEANWRTGTQRAYHYPSIGDVFVTPPVNGWTLVVGGCLLFELDQGFKSLISRLGQEFGDVCFFQSYRVSDAYAWVRAENGALTRLYSSVEGEVVSEGMETEAEMDWTLPSGGLDSDENAVFVDEDMVIDVASGWSIDPSIIETMSELRGTGFVGRNPVWGQT